MRAAVLGHPVAHSLSPVLHRAAYRAMHLDDWTYDAVDVTAEGLAEFIHGLNADWAGLSLTMPLKVAVLSLARSRSAQVERTGVANTLILRDGQHLVDNTDVPGVLGALREAAVTHVPRAAVLGAGATARSVVVALAGLGCDELDIVVRRQGSGQELAALVPEMKVREYGWDERAAEVFAAADVVVSTVPGDVVPGDVVPGDVVSGDVVAGGPVTEVVSSLPDALTGVLLDVVYAPWPTALAAAWSSRGGRVIAGHRMLLHQAVPQVALMTDREVGPDVVEAMDAALSEALGAAPGAVRP